MKKTPALIIGAIVVVIALVAIVAASSSKKTPTGGASTSTGTTSGATAPSGAVMSDKVVIGNYMFTPGDIKVKVGTTVTWTNSDSVRHNVVSDDGTMPDGKLIGKDESYTYSFTKSGTYKYHCSPHPYMHGSVTVE